MASDADRRPGLALALILALALATVAYTRSPTYVTDRVTYEQIGRQLVIPDCSNLHCTRMLVAWVIEHLPGESLAKWKAYAVLGNLLAAWGIACLCRRVGLTRGASHAAAVMSALGPGAQLTAFDPHTSDPFVYALVPWMVLLLSDGRFVIVAACAAVGVWAKEFAVAPLWIFAAFGGLQRRFDLALKAATAAAMVSTVWIGQQLWLILAHNYSYGGNSSARVLEGAYLLTWVRQLGAVQAAGALVLHFGPLAALVAAGWRHSPRSLRMLALASAPPALAFAYVQQPDRAIWNFQFVLLPVAAVVFQGAPLWLRVTWLTSFAVSNLPTEGGWGTVAAWTGFAVCAASSAVLVRSFNQDFDRANESDRLVPVRAHRPAPGWRAAMVMSVAVLTAGLVAAGDVALHRHVESGDGFNVWGYQGPVVLQTDLRVAVLGGRHLFGRQWPDSPPRVLQELLNNARLRGDAGYARPGRISVVSFTEPHEAVMSMRHTLRDAAYLNADVVCLYVGDDHPAPNAREQREGWRRRSAVYRAFGYLPALPSLFLAGYWPSPAPVAAAPRRQDAEWRDYDAALDAAIVEARLHSAVLVATHPVLGDDEAGRQDAVAARLRDRFGADRGFEHLDLRKVIDLASSLDDRDGKIVESLSQAVFRLLRAR